MLVLASSSVRERRLRQRSRRLAGEIGRQQSRRKNGELSISLQLCGSREDSRLCIGRTIRSNSAHRISLRRVGLEFVNRIVRLRTVSSTQNVGRDWCGRGSIYASGYRHGNRLHTSESKPVSNQEALRPASVRAISQQGWLCGNQICQLAPCYSEAPAMVRRLDAALIEQDQFISGDHHR